MAKIGSAGHGHSGGGHTRGAERRARAGDGAKPMHGKQLNERAEHTGPAKDAREPRRRGAGDDVTTVGGGAADDAKAGAAEHKRGGKRRKGGGGPDGAKGGCKGKRDAAEATGAGGAGAATKGGGEAAGAEMSTMAAMAGMTGMTGMAMPTIEADTSLAVANTGTGTSLLATAAARLQGSSLAQQIFAALEQLGARIDVMSDAEFEAAYPGASGVFVPNENRIVLPQSVAADPAQFDLILLHEGLHYLQDNVQGGAEALGGPVAQALQSAGAIETTTPGTEADMLHDEAQAYLVEALAAQEVGIQSDGLGVSSGGQLLGYEQIKQVVAATPAYDGL